MYQGVGQRCAAVPPHCAPQCTFLLLPSEAPCYASVRPHIAPLCSPALRPRVAPWRAYVTAQTRNVLWRPHTRWAHAQPRRTPRRSPGCAHQVAAQVRGAGLQRLAVLGCAAARHGTVRGRGSGLRSGVARGCARAHFGAAYERSWWLLRNEGSARGFAHPQRVARQEGTVGPCTDTGTSQGCGGVHHGAM